MIETLVLRESSRRIGNAEGVVVEDRKRWGCRRGG
jgi:hypothetical protein